MSRLIEPETLCDELGQPSRVIVDVRKAEDYARAHLPGSVFLDRSLLVAKHPPVGGLLPPRETLEAVLGAVGLTREAEVVAYDDEGGGWAGRLMWTLDALDHRRSRLLNGGWVAWQQAGLPVESGVVEPRSASFVAGHRPEVIAERHYILSRLGAKDFSLLDTRTPEEFAGEKRLAARGGHIPGAVNLDWVRAMDRERGLRLLPVATLETLLGERGVTPDKEVVVYCQTHHRSSHTYVMLKHLGFERVRGYPGAWSDWGNREDTPVE